MIEIKQKIKELNLPFDEIVIKKVSYSIEDFFIMAIEHWHSKDLANFLNCNVNTISRATYKLFPDLKGSKMPLGAKIAGMLGYKNCRGCSSLVSKSLFSKDKNRSDGLQPLCKICQGINNKNYYDANTEKFKEWGKTWRSLNSDKVVYYSAKRRAAKLERTPPWADLDEIESIYKNCPAGYQVDHIIPLQGEKVSGLHVESNLQYLTKEENLKKSNKYDC